MWVSGPRMRGVLPQDLPAIDNKLRGVLSSSGEPHPNAADVDGAVLARARADKETYPELLTGRCRLVVMAIETGGRWSCGAMDFVQQLARQSRGSFHMRFLIAVVWELRWTRMLSTACSLVLPPPWWKLQTSAQLGVGQVESHRPWRNCSGKIR